jgi:hypothetical protein
MFSPVLRLTQAGLRWTNPYRHDVVYVSVVISFLSDHDFQKCITDAVNSLGSRPDATLCLQNRHTALQRGQDCSTILLAEITEKVRTELVSTKISYHIYVLLS